MFSKFTFNYEEFTLEQFQLENLLTGGVNFRLYYLDEPVNKENVLVKLILEKGEYKPQALEMLSQPSVDKDMPILIICNDAKKSKKVIKKISKLNFKNIYFLKDGLQSLL